MCRTVTAVTNSIVLQPEATCHMMDVTALHAENAGGTAGNIVCVCLQESVAADADCINYFP